MSKLNLKLTINGKPVKTSCHGMDRLLDVIREPLGLTGTKEGCGEGECGACSVMLNGRVVNSCLVPAIQAQGATVTTVEGLGRDKLVNKIQQAFLENGGAQCGICTPGMVIAATDLLERHPNPTIEQIRTGLSGNLCRCTGYTKIFESVVAACRMEQR